MLPSYVEDDKRAPRRSLRPRIIVFALAVLALFAVLQLSSFLAISQHQSPGQAAKKPHRADDLQSFSMHRDGVHAKERKTRPAPGEPAHQEQHTGMQALYERSMLKLAVPGVAPADQALYETAIAKGRFRCLQSHEEIDAHAINDDYCDCSDGTDEPGTSACPNARFYCHPQREYLRSSTVNDGVCDCCDGSDEHMLSSSYACGNACASIEQAHRAQEARQQRGLALRADLVREAQRMSADARLQRGEWGPDGAFYELTKACLKATFSEFTYDVCLFDRVDQTDRSMHAVSLGRKAEWRVPGKEVLFTNGDMCHGIGAARSVKVTFECSDETKIQQISEPERCFYHVEMQTPAACSPL